MSLRELQRSFARVVLSSAPAPEDLAALGGDALRWRIYREMVRGRLHDTVAEVLPRTRAIVTPERFAAEVDHWLAERPPRTRYVHALALEFARHFVWRCAPDARVMDVLNYERAIIHAVNAPDAPPECAEFEMHLPAYFAPSASLVKTRHDVLSDAVEENPRSLLVYRDAETHRIETLTLLALAADVTERMLAGGPSVTACAQAVMATLPPDAHEGFAQMLAELLGDYLDRGVILGSHATG